MCQVLCDKNFAGMSHHNKMHQFNFTFTSQSISCHSTTWLQIDQDGMATLSSNDRQYSTYGSWWTIARVSVKRRVGQVILDSWSQQIKSCCTSAMMMTKLLRAPLYCRYCVAYDCPPAASRRKRNGRTVVCTKTRRPYPKRHCTVALITSLLLPIPDLVCCPC